jgi:hypothetical protein
VIKGADAMSLPVRLEDVVDALEMTAEFSMYFLDRRTGEIELITDEVWSAAENDKPISEFPEWERKLILKAKEIQTTDHFVELPDRVEMDTYEIMKRFCAEYPNQQISQRLLASIKAKGAFRRFKDLISNLRIEEEWNRFERQSFEELAVEWLEDEEIPYTR